MELSRSDKLNLILLFLTLGSVVFYCKRHKWKYRQMFTVYYFNIPIPGFIFLERKIEYVLYRLLYPNFITLIFNIRSDFDLYCKVICHKYFEHLAFSQMQHHCITYVTHINTCKINIKPKSPIKCMHLG